MFCFFCLLRSKIDFFFLCVSFRNYFFFVDFGAHFFLIFYLVIFVFFFFFFFFFFFLFGPIKKTRMGHFFSGIFRKNRLWEFFSLHFRRFFREKMTFESFFFFLRKSESFIFGCRSFFFCYVLFLLFITLEN
eukprot:TRINITY_DN1506_c0_g1_i4.p1 TRINITY_DN1506_c0_g1~~TRINITY_DN1506_c0_g1_i4.p1  ORF type:complete len:153 (+),score=83.66 TRINITY_DN1506_c0_g1_i4:65-460(+)